MRWKLLLLLTFVLSGCQIFGTDDSNGSDLDDNREKWEAYSDGSYRFTLLRGCFCAYGGTFLVEVEDDQVVSAFDVNQNSPVPQRDLDIFETIDDIFEMIEEAHRDADEVEIDYSENGYPATIRIDWIKQAVDDEMYMEITHVVM